MDLIKDEENDSGVDFVNSFLKFLMNNSLSMSPNNTLGCAGNVVLGNFCSFGSTINNFWMLDSGVTYHTCNKHLFDTMDTLKHFVTISLPNGTIASINQARNISVNPNLFIQDVLYILAFRFKLLFVSKLLNDNNLFVLLLLVGCLIQDLKTREVMAVGQLKGRQYKLTRSSFLKNKIFTFVSQV